MFVCLCEIVGACVSDAVAIKQKQSSCDRDGARAGGCGAQCCVRFRLPTEEKYPTPTAVFSVTICDETDQGEADHHRLQITVTTTQAKHKRNTLKCFTVYRTSLPLL